MKKVTLNFHNDEDYSRYLKKLETSNGFYSVFNAKNETIVEVYSAK